MEPLTVVGPVNYRTGYGIDTCRKVMALLNLGYEVLVRATRYEDNEEGPVPYAVQERLIYQPIEGGWEWLNCPPCFHPTAGSRTIYASTLETDGMAPGAADLFNQAILAVVPCRWNQEAMRRAGVTVPVLTCRESVDPLFFEAKRRLSQNTLVFGTAGNAGPAGGHRKGLDLVAQAFLKAFPTERHVELRVKGGPSMVLRHADIRIRLDKRSLTPLELRDWYSELDVFVSGSRGEAWGRMVHEAMACGVPVIGASYGGQAELIEDRVGWHCGYIIRPATGEYDGLGNWCEPSVDWMAMVMREVCEKTDRQRIRKGYKAKLKAWECNDGELEDLTRILWEAGYRKPIAKQKRRWLPTDEDLIIDFYRDKQSIPKLPLREDFIGMGLTNTPTGIGDTMLLSPFPLIGTPVRSPAPCFEDLKRFVPHYKETKGGQWIAADMLQKRYAMGNGHLMQRLHRVFGCRVPDRPQGHLLVGSFQVRGRVAIHLTPGRHADWQRRYVHARAREVYPENATIIQQFMKGHSEMDFVEVGSERSGLVPQAHDCTGLDMGGTLRVLAECEYFLGIMSGPLHLATALGCRCVVIINFPEADQIFLPALKDIPLVEHEWFFPQHCHLHQDGEGKQVKRFNRRNLERAFDGQLYPYWSEDYLHLIHENV
jgi:hypothetical protein